MIGYECSTNTLFCLIFSFNVSPRLPRIFTVYVSAYSQHRVHWLCGHWVRIGINKRLKQYPHILNKKLWYTRSFLNFKKKIARAIVDNEKTLFACGTREKFLLYDKHDMNEFSCRLLKPIVEISALFLKIFACLNFERLLYI